MSKVFKGDNLNKHGEVMVKRIGMKNSIYDKLVDYKNKKALLQKKSNYSFGDAILDLLEESELLEGWMKGKKTSS